MPCPDHELRGSIALCVKLAAMLPAAACNKHHCCTPCCRDVSKAPRHALHLLLGTHTWLLSTAVTPIYARQACCIPVQQRKHCLHKCKHWAGENIARAALLSHQSCTTYSEHHYRLWTPRQHNTPKSHSAGINQAAPVHARPAQKLHLHAEDTNTALTAVSVICEQHPGTDVIIQGTLLLLRPTHAWGEPSHLWRACEHAQDDTEGRVRPHTLTTQGLQL